MLHMYDGILFTYCEGKYLILLFFFFFFGIFRHLRGRQWLFTWAEFHRSDWQLLWQQWHRLEIMSRHAGLPIVCGFLLEYFESENRVRRHAQLHQTQRNAHRQAWLVYSFFFCKQINLLVLPINRKKTFITNCFTRIMICNKLTDSFAKSIVA